MSNPSGRKGTYWETRLTNWLRTHGWPHAERRARAGICDKGDLTGLGSVVVECKNTKKITLAQFLDEAEVERQHAGAMFGVVCVPRRNHEVGKGYFIMSIEAGFHLLHLAEKRFP